LKPKEQNFQPEIKSGLKRLAPHLRAEKIKPILKAQPRLKALRQTGLFARAKKHILLY
jgi:hypothetical protein